MTSLAKKPTTRRKIGSGNEMPAANLPDPVEDRLANSIRATVKLFGEPERIGFVRRRRACERTGNRPLVNGARGHGGRHDGRGCALRADLRVLGSTDRPLAHDSPGSWLSRLSPRECARRRPANIRVVGDP